MNEYERAIFDGNPRTRWIRDIDGEQGYEVYVYVLTPERVLLSEKLASLTIAGIIVSCFLIGHVGLFFASLLTIFAHGTIAQQYAYKFLVGTTLIFTPTKFRVQRGELWEVFDRTIKHSFVLLDHDQAREERESDQRRAQIAQMKRQVCRPRNLYTDSFHVALIHFGQRRDIVDVYIKKRAEAIAARLQAVDTVMDGLLGMGDAPATKPSDQWNDQSGHTPKAGELP